MGPPTKGMAAATRPSEHQASPHSRGRLQRYLCARSLPRAVTKLSALRRVRRLTTILLNLGVSVSECVSQQHVLHRAYSYVVQHCLRCPDSRPVILACFARGAFRGRSWPRVLSAVVRLRHDQARLCCKCGSRLRFGGKRVGYENPALPTELWRMTVCGGGWMGVLAGEMRGA